jgi:hypothetical protein
MCDYDLALNAEYIRRPNDRCTTAPTPTEPPSPPIIPVSQSDGMTRYMAWLVERANVLAANERPDLHKQMSAMEGEERLVEKLIRLSFENHGAEIEFGRIDSERRD